MSPSGKENSIQLRTYVDLVCDQFEQQFRSGNEPRIEDCLEEADLAARPELFRKLLEVELELKRRSDCDLALQDYLSRFPNSPEAVQAAFSAIGPNEPALDQTVVFENRNIQAQPESMEATLGPSQSATDTFRSSQRKRLGRFEIVSVLGQGAFGKVYLAHDPKLAREVAIKVPSKLVAGNEIDLLRFLREARTAADLMHENICPVYEIGELDGTHFIVMGYIKGHTLREHIQNNQLSSDQAAQLMQRLAKALQYAHNKGVVHRDLKPANVIFDDKRQQPVIMDFGLAHKAIDSGEASLTQEGVLMGTPTHMSPEQARGATGDVSPSFDIYGLGVVMYEALCGQLPFVGSVTEVLGQVLHVDPESPSARRENVDPRLEAICLKLMAKRPEDRYATMEEVASALAEYSQEPLPRSSLQVDQDERLSTPTLPLKEASELRQRGAFWRRRSILAAALGLAAITVVAAAIILLRTKYGTLQIEVHDPDVLVFVDDESIQFKDGRFQGKEKAEKHSFYVKVGEIRVPLNNPEIEIDGQERELVVRLDGERISSDKFEIVSNKTSTLRISLMPLRDETNGVGPQTAISQLEQASARLTLEHDLVNAVAISPNGRWLVTGSVDGTIRRWEPNSGDPPASSKILLGHSSSIQSLRISPNSRWLISGSTGNHPQQDEARLWDLTSQDPSALSVELAKHKLRHLSSDGRWLITRDEDGARLRDLSSRDPSVSSMVFQERGLRYAVTSPDSRWLITTRKDPEVPASKYKPASKDNMAHLWDLTSMDPSASSVVLEGHEHIVEYVAGNSKNRWLVTGSKDAARLCNLDDLSNSKEFSGTKISPQGMYSFPAVSPDGRWLIAPPHLWDLTASDPSASTVELVDYSKTHHLLIDPDSLWAATAGACNSLNWPRAFGKKDLQHHPTLAISHDSRWLVAGSLRQPSAVRLWDLSSQDPWHSTKVLRGHARKVRSICFSPDGRWLVTGSEDETARIWDLASEDPSASSVLLRGHKSMVVSLKFSPDSRWLVTKECPSEQELRESPYDGLSHLWDLSSDDPSTSSLVLGTLKSVAISRDSRWLATACSDNKVRVWDLNASLPTDKGR